MADSKTQNLMIGDLLRPKNVAGEMDAPLLPRFGGKDAALNHREP